MLLLISFLSLFLELCLIRWVSVEIRIFAYCKNLVLLAAFLGLGIGCFFKERKTNIFLSFVLVTLLVVLVEFPNESVQMFGPRGITNALSVFTDFQVFDYSISGGVLHGLSQFILGMTWVALVFFGIAAICYPYGQIIGRLIGRFEKNLVAYSLNIFGALLGILAFNLFSYFETQPLQWFAFIFLLSLPFLPNRRWIPGTFLLLVVMAFLTLEGKPHELSIWSLYQKLDVKTRTGVVLVNNTGFQKIAKVPSFRGSGPHVDRWSMPYLIQGAKPNRVLIVGAGIGNDVAFALAAGVQDIVAVEIDPAICRIGAWLNPYKPYDSSQVMVVVDDARHFFKTAEGQFDLIIFSHLDAHTLLSGYTNVRLDNYIYTVESFLEAKELLKEDGLIYLSFFAEKPWIIERFHNNLEQAFGHAPLTILAEHPPSIRYLELVHFFIAFKPKGAELFDPSYSGWDNYKFVDIEENETPCSTDDWPFLYVAKRQIPFLVVAVSAILFIISGLFLRRTFSREDRIDWHFFFLGASFMLIEVHDVSKLALLFGTTWWVNTWVISSILMMILLANAFVSWFRPASYQIYYVLLALSLTVAYLFPVDSLSRLPQLWTVFLSLLLLTAPIFFAGVIFAVSFAAARKPAIVFGSNMLGAILGGLLESFSFVGGLRSLILVSLILYVLSFLALRRQPGKQFTPGYEVEM